MNWHRQRAFSLVELIVALAVIAILAGLGLAAANSAQSTARDEQRKTTAARIVSTIDAYFRENGIYPGTITFSTNQVVIGSRNVPLTGYLSYSGTTTNASSTRYYYQVIGFAYILCVGRESGGWIRTGPSPTSCP